MYKFNNSEPDNLTYDRQFELLSFDNPMKPLPHDLSSNTDTYDHRETTTSYFWSLLDNILPSMRGKSYGHDTSPKETNDTKQRKLDSFTGSVNDLSWRPKMEQQQLFKNSVNWTDAVNGVPCQTNEMEKHIIPTVTKNGVLPFEQHRETPGLNLGNYENLPTFGPYVPHRVLPKTIDEMRSENNPRIEDEYVLSTPGAGQRGRIHYTEVECRKPPTFYENDPANMLPTDGISTKPRIYSDPLVQPTERSMNANLNYVGPMYSNSKNRITDVPKPDVTGKDIIADNTRVGNPGLSQMGQSAPGYQVTQEYSQRESFESNPYIGSVSDINKSMACNYLPHATTGKDLLLGPSQMSPVSLTEKGVARSFDGPNTTQRNTFENTTYIPGMSSSSVGYINTTWDPGFTQRNSFENTEWLSPHATSNKGIVSTYEPHPTTTKELGIDNNRIGNMTGDDKTPINSAPPEPTQRLTFRDNTYIPGVHGTEMNRWRGEDFTRTSEKDCTLMGRMPTLSNYNKTPSTALTQYRLTDRTQEGRFEHPGMGNMNLVQTFDLTCV